MFFFACYNQNMKLLLSNDDGIDAEGLQILADALKDEHDVYIAAPSSQRSAYSHSVTYFYSVNHAYRKKLPGIREAYAIDGTPADCVYYGLCGLFDVTIDAVISGINNGRNLSSDCVYSGTVGAAAEGTLSFVPSIAVSLCGRDLVHYDTAARVLKMILPAFLEDPRRLDYMLNVNVPDLPYEELKGFRASVFDTPVDYRRPITKETVDADTLRLSMETPAPKKYDAARLPDGDSGAVSEGYVSMTPLWFDMVRNDCLDNVRKLEMLF